MTDYERLCDEIKLLTPEQQQQVLIYIQNLRTSCSSKETTISSDSGENKGCNTSKESAPCPYCGSENVIRFGYKCGKQRFRCKDCLKVFMSTTKTVMENSRLDEDAWRTVIKDTLNGHVSLDQTAEKIGVSHTTAFNMRHKVLIALENHLNSDPVILQDISELDETYVLESYKGKKFAENAPRKPRRHGAKASSRGISEEQICIMAGVQRNGGPAYATTANRAHPSKEEIEIAFKNHIGAGCVAFTDGLKGYKYLEDITDCAIESVSTEKQKVSKTANLNNVNSFHSHIKDRYNQYRGVATKYINRYNALFSATYRMKNDLEDEIYNLLSKSGTTMGSIKCKDVYTKGLVTL